MNKETIRKTIEALESRQLTDDEVQKLAEHEPSFSDRYDRCVAPILFEDGNIDIGSPRTFEGNQHPLLGDSVIGTFGVGPRTKDDIRQSFRASKQRVLESYQKQLDAINNFPP